MNNFIWAEKHRPTSFDTYVFHDEYQRKAFKEMADSGQISHLLFSGVQGTGKTTLSKIMIDALGIPDEDVLLVNASEETGVDAMRDKIASFAQLYPVGGKFKVVQLEEMDYLSQNAQGALRHVMGEYAENCRFIATCNYENKVIPALKSRFQHIHFKTPPMEDVMVNVAEIMMQEGVEFEIEDLEDVTKAYYPDIRKIINVCQQYSKGGKLVKPTANSDTADWKLKLVDLLKAGNFRDARKLVCDTASREEIEDVYTFLYNNISNLSKDVNKQEECIVVIADYLRSHALVADVEINLAAAFIRLGQVVNG